MDEELTVTGLGLGTFWSFGSLNEQISLVLHGAKKPQGRQTRDLTIKLSPEQWAALAGLVKERERLDHLRSVAKAELEELYSGQAEEQQIRAAELYEKLGMKDWPQQLVPRDCRPKNKR